MLTFTRHGELSIRDARYGIWSSCWRCRNLMPAANPPTVDALLAGGIGGACLCLVGAPFDVVKVRQQHHPSSSALEVVRSIVRVEGIRGLWRGVTAPLLVAVPQFAVVFGAYAMARSLVQRISSKPQENARDTAIAGALVALPTSFIYTPVDRVKLAMQVDGHRVASGQVARYSCVRECIYELWRAGGIASFSRGFTATLARDVPAWATYFAVYATLKQTLSPSTGVLDGRAKLSPAASLVAGGAAGAASWAVCFPIDVVKTRFQSDLTYRTYRCTIRAVLRSSGIGGLFAGYWTIVLGGVPRDAACLTGTEAAQRALTLRRQSIIV